MKRIVRWVVVLCLGLIGAAVAGLAVNGLPRPPAITVEGVPRVPWSPAFTALGGVRRIMTGVSFVAWHPGENGIVVSAFAGTRQQLHLINKPGAAPVVLTSVDEPPDQVRMNPDPERGSLVFAMDVGGSEQYQLFRLTLADSRVTPVTGGTGRNMAGSFDPGGTLLAYTSTRRNGADTDLYLVDPGDPATERLLAEVEGTWYPGAWSPDGNHLLVNHFVSVREARTYLVALATGVMTPLLPDQEGPAADCAAVFSTDGTVVYLASDRGTEHRTLRQVDLASGEVTQLTSSIPWDVEEIALAPDGSHLALVINEDGVRTLSLLALTSGRVSPVSGLPDGVVGRISFHARRNRLAWTHTTLAGVNVPCSYDLDAGKVTIWAEVSPSRVPGARLIHYPSFDQVDGQPRLISAFVMAPAADVPGPWPVLISIHGGPESQAGPILNPMLATVQARGVAVIVPNVRGSTGYGKRFHGLDNGRLREDAVKDIGALLDWIGQQPELDPGRVGVVGASYGGYMALAAAVFYSDRLRCAMDLFGISSFVSFLERTMDYRRDLRRAEYGDERDPAMRSFLTSISPLNHADRITVPLLVYGGLNDPRVPVSESRQIVRTVREHGGEVWYLEAADEGHSLDRPANMLYVGSASLAFLERFLLPLESER